MIRRRAPALWFAVALCVNACAGRSASPSLKTTNAKEADDENDAKSADLAEFDLTSGVSETPESSRFFSLPASRTYVGLVRELERVRTDKKIRGAFVKIGEASFDWAHAEEIGHQLSLLKDAGKSVVCHAHTLDNAASFLVARGCSKIWVSPAGDVDTVGIAGQVVYLKGALDKLKIHADFLHMGKYKSAAESLTREGPSDEARSALTAVLSSIRRTWIDGVHAARSSADVVPALEDGPFGPDDAKTRGLIDGVGYEDDARSDLQALAHAHHFAVKFGAKRSDDSGLDVGAIVRMIAGDDGDTHKPHVVVVPAEGSIAMGAGGSLLSDSGITESSMHRVIHRLADDDAVKAVVLRIDSPGGSALASDLLWHELMRLRKKKPLVASVGEMAASGGYYLACAANKIVADRTSIVGSIGVLGGKIVIGDALSEFGVHAETFPANPDGGAAARAGYLSPFDSWDDATRERVNRQMDAVYELFLRRVAEGRALPVDAVRAVAEGRIWSGVQGKDLRLVDELGGLDLALDVARRLAKLGKDVPVRVEGVRETLLESLFSGTSDEAFTQRVLAGASDPPHTVLNQVEAVARPFVGAVAPLLNGETAVASLPFAFSVK